MCQIMTSSYPLKDDLQLAPMHGLSPEIADCHRIDKLIS